MELDATQLIGALCAHHRVPFDAALLRQRFPPPHGADAVLPALRQLGFHAKASPCLPSALSDKSLPLLALLASGQFAMVLAASGNQVVVLDGAGNSQPQSIEDFAQSFANEIIQVKPKVKAPSDPDAVAGQSRFGFRWFVPELLKHKTVWRQVLLASLFLQLLSLAFPLITQAVVDKVVVHRTQSTLIVLGSAMVLISEQN